jgi:high-affinity nickel permease
MSLMDSIDGSFMSFASGWAFSKPVRKVFSNLAVTGLSVAVALSIGTIELGGLVASELNVSGPFWKWFENINIQHDRLCDRRHVRNHVGDRPVDLALRAHRTALER